jgi:hypothetical protein
MVEQDAKLVIEGHPLKKIEVALDLKTKTQIN